MKRALIRPEKCSNCQPCEVEEQCPMKAVFREEANERPWVDFYRCSGCLTCKTLCVGGAIATPICFELFGWLQRTLAHRGAAESSFRPDREIRRGRL